MSVIILVALIGLEANTLNADKETVTCGTDIINLNKTYNDAFCYDVKDMDDLELYNDKAWLGGSIYFIDSSCKGGLNVREACSVEAAAKMNPSRQVNVFFVGPVQVMCLTSEPLISLLTYHNVQLRRIYVNEFANSTELGHLLNQSVITSGPHPNLYALEVLKYLTLYKFDGIYMDLDVMATRPFSDLLTSGNWMAIEDHKQGTLSSAIFAASLDTVGREVIESVINVLRDNASSWTLRIGPHSGKILKDALEKRYGYIPFDAGVKGYSYKQRDSLILYASKFFFPISCKNSAVYFQKKTAKFSSGAFTHRFCSDQTFRDVIVENSNYAFLMKKHCPKVYKHIVRTEFNNKKN